MADLTFIAATPVRIAALLQGLSDADLSWHPEGADWSVHGHHVNWSLAQHVCHLRDLEREGYGIRIARLGEEERPVFPDIDGDRLAAERDYDRQDVRRAAADFAAARFESLHRARTGAPRGRGVLEGVGEVTLADLLELVRRHDSGHLETMQRMADALRAGLAGPD